MPAQKRSFPDSTHDHHRQSKHPQQQQPHDHDDEEEDHTNNKSDDSYHAASSPSEDKSELYSWTIARILRVVLIDFTTNNCMIGSGDLGCYGAVVDDIYEKHDRYLKLNLGFSVLEFLVATGFVYVELLEIRKEVQCPICLGIIKKTRTVMECLHRFCRECIDKSMRLGNNECPACRTHCASRRSLRDDPNYDALIAALYPDIEKYEEEELEFREEDKNRNKLIQASIAKVVQRQSEALVKRRRDTPGRDTPGSFVTRSQRNQRNVLSRRQNQAIDNQGSEDNEEENDNNEKDSSSTDERGTELRQRRRKRRTRVRPSQPSSSTASPDGGGMESDMDISRENRGISSRQKPQKLTWGRGGFRSHTRHGSGNGSNSKSSRSSRLAKLVDYLRNLNENTEELDVHLMLLSLDKQSTTILQQPHLCCRPTLSVKHLCEYVARHTPLPVEEVEILAVKGCCRTGCDKSADELTTLVIDPSKDELETLQGDESLAGIKFKCMSKRGHLILAYRRKE